MYSYYTCIRKELGSTCDGHTKIAFFFSNTSFKIYTCNFLRDDDGVLQGFGVEVLKAGKGNAIFFMRWQYIYSYYSVYVASF